MPDSDGVVRIELGRSFLSHSETLFAGTAAILSGLVGCSDAVSSSYRRVAVWQPADCSLLGVSIPMQPPQNLADFRSAIVQGEPGMLAEEFIFSATVHALPDEAAYNSFRQKVSAHLPDAEYVSIVGSGNWRYSLNPEKLLTEYHKNSDIDVAVVSSKLYGEIWDEMRRIHRDKWYAMDLSSRGRLVRNGQNVYSGFACPVWIPQAGHPKVYSFKSMLNKLSGPEIGYRAVKMMYFKNDIEMIDYYRRGFTEAKRGITA